ncbi:MAG: GPR endopeptidase [Sellimonas sp.]|uniref:GPR endopeptidase n=1 Tax=Drancourtella sp. An57 TaxID=1965647 RepID=UPI000B39F774|nr:GPR endopeptidase [Drancourtella sp. An57]MEE0781578.1 GPR endopeptidase [Sellimonas sp.]OUN69572.1 GPR endopeptidase [Drancourtella sp. An57]HIV94648.1 GPR endopeptidase [Candidatus Sellimonas avistercoris]
MVEKYSIRTDLALEEKERFEEENVEVQGVVLEEEYDEEREIRTTTVKIKTENGAKTMGKPVGTYITMEAPNLAVPDEGYHREVSVKIAECVEKLLKGKWKKRSKDEDISILMVGLGNREVTPDALGPYVADNLNITRHIVREYGKYAMGEDEVTLVSALVPGVMAQTGMETAEIVRGVVAETKPDVILVVDALAARNSKRLNRTIQIADTGISPGSGVGNHRNAITEDSIGIPVIAIGVPTVVDAATIVNDAMENLMKEMEHSEALKGVGVVLQGYHAAEKYELVRQLISPHLNGMFVTPKDIDDTVKRISFTISEGLNLLFSRNEERGEMTGQAHNHEEKGI